MFAVPARLLCFALAPSLCSFALGMPSRYSESIHQTNGNIYAREANIPAGTAKHDTSMIASAYLFAHNIARMEHGARNLTWSNTLAEAAGKWAGNCKFKHSGGLVGPFGENLAAGTGDFTVFNAIDMWLDEASQYNPHRPLPSHFTQVVWKSSSQVGCSAASCSNMFPSMENAIYHVCEYFPPGNVIGQFLNNIAP